MPYHEKNISTKCLGSGSCFVNFHPKNPLVIISELPAPIHQSHRCTVWAIMTVAAIQSQGQDQMTIVVPCWTIGLWTSSGQHSSRLKLVSDRPWTHWLSWCLGTIQFLSIPSIIIPSPFTSLRGVTLYHYRHVYTTILWRWLFFMTWKFCYLLQCFDWKCCRNSLLSYWRRWLLLSRWER